MAATKSQLPMVRALKTIARRKANACYSTITIPPDVLKQLTAEALKAKATQQKEIRRFISRRPKDVLLAVAMFANTTTTPAELALRKQFEKDIETIKEAYPRGYAHDVSYQWRLDQRADHLKLFNELEAIELQIISGEAVDLAPYANRLK